MTTHSARPSIAVPASAAPVKKARHGRHRDSLLRTLQRMAEAGDWHAFWCRLGDAFDEAADIAIAWLTVVLGIVAAVALGAVVGFAGGPLAAAAYVLAVAVAAALWVRSGRSQR